MKVLLDECLPRKLKRDLPGHEAVTVPEMGWRGLKNSELLRQAEATFDAFITIDQGLRYQQNLKAGLAVVLLAAPNNRLETLRPLMPKVLAAPETIRKGEMIRITA
jgi:predicted nuclease of predicted toxin-antitoxin system